MLLHSPQAARTALPASTTQSDPHRRAKHVRMVAFLKLPPHHARSATQGRVMLTVIQPQRAQRVPLASTLQLDRTELMARSPAVYRVRRVSMMMTATLRRLACSVLWARCSRRRLKPRAATVQWGSISQRQVRQCALTVVQARTSMWQDQTSARTASTALPASTCYQSAALLRRTASTVAPADILRNQVIMNSPTA